MNNERGKIMARKKSDKPTKTDASFRLDPELRKAAQENIEFLGINSFSSYVHKALEEKVVRDKKRIEIIKKSEKEEL